MSDTLTEDEPARSSSGATESCAQAEPTPGPWTITDVEVVDGAVTVTTGDGQLAQGIAYVPGEAENWPEDVQQANAQLIAAAPNLLEAAKKMLQLEAAQYGSCAEVADSVRDEIRGSVEAAIAKAEGEA